jgi:F-type H+-transporting ATPase subunit alpha
MELPPRAVELMTLLESRMTYFYTNFQVNEIGWVVSVGDGIARDCILNEIQAGEIIFFNVEVVNLDANSGSILNYLL